MLGSWVLGKAPLAMSSCLTDFLKWMSSSIALFQEYTLTIVFLTCDFLTNVIFLYQSTFSVCDSQVLIALIHSNIFVKEFIGSNTHTEVETFSKPFGDVKQS